jgi:hypothetical protein
LSFPYQVVGTTSAQLPLTLSNPGAAPLIVGSVSATGDFAVANDACGGTTIAVAASCTIEMTFTPTANGLRTGTLVVGSNNVGGTAAIPLSGQGEQNGAAIQLSASSLTFGPQPVGTTSTPQTVTVASVGASSVTFTSIVANGDFIQTNNCPQTLPGNGATCTLTISFQPTAAGPRTGSVVLTDTAGTQTVSLSGTATAPQVMLSPTSLTFAPQIVKKPSNAQTISLTNTGDASLTISGIAIAGANPADYSQTNDCGTSLPINTTCSINVIFKPLGLDARTASVTITDNAANSPQAVPLGGVGTQVKITPIALKFGSVVVGSSATKILTFANLGTTAVHIAGISFTGANVGDFSETSICGPTVAPKSTCTVTLTFTPLAKGARSATIAFSDDGGASPQTVPLTGTGK